MAVGIPKHRSPHLQHYENSPGNYDNLLNDEMLSANSRSFFAVTVAFTQSGCSSIRVIEIDRGRSYLVEYELEFVDKYMAN